MFGPSSPTSHASGWLPRGSARQDSGPIGASRWTAFRIHSPSRPLCSSARLPARAVGRRSGAAFGSGRIGICAVSSSPTPMEQLPGSHFCCRSDPAYVAVLWKQARMVLPIAEVMRPDLDALSDRSDRRLAGGLRNVIAVGRRFSILPGFLSSRLGRATRSLAPRADARGGAAVRVGSWIFPTASMAIMSHYCDTRSRTVDTHARVRATAEPLNPACVRAMRASTRGRRR